MLSKKIFVRTIAMASFVFWMEATGADAKPTLEVNPTPILFNKDAFLKGDLDLFGQAYQRKVQIKNAGDGVLKVENVSLFNAETSAFKLNNDLSLPISLSAGQSIDLKVYYFPYVPANREAILKIQSSGSSLDVNVQADPSIGWLTLLSPYKMNFASQTQSQQTQSIELRNDSPYDVSITGIHLEDKTGASGAFTTQFPSSLPYTLSPNKTIRILVRFSPPQEGGHLTFLTVETNSLNDAGHILLSGCGSQNMLSIDPIYDDPDGYRDGCLDTVYFYPRPFGQPFEQWSSQTVTIKNINSSAVRWSVALSGPNAEDFRLKSNPDPMIFLQPQRTEPFIFEFAPKTHSPNYQATATFTVTDPVGTTKQQSFQLIVTAGSWLEYQHDWWKSHDPQPPMPTPNPVPQSGCSVVSTATTSDIGIGIFATALLAGFGYVLLHRNRSHLNQL